jgi:hypothetical protein
MRAVFRDGRMLRTYAVRPVPICTGPQSSVMQQGVAGL